MRTKDYEPLTFILPRSAWKYIARAVGGSLSNDILHKQGFHPYKLSFFQSDVEKIMNELENIGYQRSKEALQVQIDKYIETGDWK